MSINEINLSKSLATSGPTRGAWEVSILFEGTPWARFYHYKKDAQQFKQKLERAVKSEGKMFYPESYHMYEQHKGYSQGRKYEQTTYIKYD